MSWLRYTWLLLMLPLLGAASAPQTFNADNVGGPFSDKPGELYLPTASPPFPAVVVLHGCDGVTAHFRDWAERLAGWGYAALLVDSYRPRGFANICNRGYLVPPALRAADAFAAAALLRTRKDVRGDRIGVIGFSHGGYSVLKAVLAAPDHVPPFAAAVAFYPGCERPLAPLISDTLILIGEADDWMSAGDCQRWHDGVATNGHVVALTIYPGAMLGFDNPTPMHVFQGHHIGGDAAAAADAIAATRDFLAERLQPGQ